MGRSGKVVVNFDDRYAAYSLDDLSELTLSYASTIHKAQGSEYDTVIIPLLMAHRILLTRNLLYTAVTRAKRRVLLVGQKKALYTAIHTAVSPVADHAGRRNKGEAGQLSLAYRQEIPGKPLWLEVKEN